MRAREAKRLVERSYDLIAEAYLASRERDDPDTNAPVEERLAE